MICLFPGGKINQDVGTCPAVDWLRYRDVLSHSSLP